MYVDLAVTTMFSFLASIYFIWCQLLQYRLIQPIEQLADWGFNKTWYNWFDASYLDYKNKLNAFWENSDVSVKATRW